MKQLFTLLSVAACLTAIGQVPVHVPTNGLVAYYPLDGDLIDIGPFGHDGTLFGGSLAEDRFGNFSSISFDGAAAYGSLGNLSPIQSGVAGEFTISLWLNLNSHNAQSINSVIISDEYATNNGVILQTNLADGLFSYYPPVPYTLCGCEVALQQWHHIVLRQSAIGSEIILDGITYSLGSGTNEETQEDWTIARFTQGGRFLDGRLDDIGIWSRALDDSEVQTLFLSSAPVTGCIELQACNFNLEANVDDGSCVFPPNIALGEDIETCEDSVVLDAGEGFNFYEWSTGETTQTIVVTETGEYAVSASNVIENNHALQFDGTDATGAPAEPILFGMESFSVSVDCKLNAFKGNDSEPYSYIIGHPLTQGTGDHGFKIQTAGTSLNGGFQVHINDEGTTHFNVISFDNGMETNVELDQWYDLTMVVDRDNAQFSFYVDGVLIETQTIHPDFGNVDHPNGMSLGVQSIHGSSLLNGDLDNLQIWDVALSAEEVAHWQTTVPSGSETGLVGYWNFEEGEGDEANDLSQVAPTIALNNVGWTDNTPIDVFDASCAASDTIQVSWLIRGCTDPEACNYVEDASCDDGTCASCEALQTACGPGTIWDTEMQMCIGDGSGDINLDGCVQLNDLLDLLSAYGNCAAEESAWQCGDPLEYQGYDYATVLIGNQCWFAENLKKLDAVYPGTSQSYNDPRSYVYGYNGENVNEAMLQANYDEFGVLYNYAAVQSEDLCPAGWTPGTDGDWNTLAVALGVDSTEAYTYICCGGAEYRGDVAPLMKDESWGGLNTSGFGALPGGYLNDTPSPSSFLQMGVNGYFWTTTEAIQYYAPQGTLEQTAMSHYLYDGIDGVGRIVTNRQHAFSVRCVKDAE